jgi:hypothetical protein
MTLPEEKHPNVLECNEVGIRKLEKSKVNVLESDGRPNYEAETNVDNTGTSGISGKDV